MTFWLDDEIIATESDDFDLKRHCVGDAESGVQLAAHSEFVLFVMQIRLTYQCYYIIIANSVNVVSAWVEKSTK